MRTPRGATSPAWPPATWPDDWVRDGAEALRPAREAAAEEGCDRCRALDALAAACAEVGEYDQAVATAERLCLVLGGHSASPSVEAARGRLALYRSGLPYRESR